MTRRHLASATLVAALTLSVLPGAAAAQDTVEPADEDASARSISGTISYQEGVWYITPDQGDPIALSFGPAWFNDLGALFGFSDGDEVTVEGNVRDGMPNETASDTAKDKAVKDPVVKIKREKGKPPWTGGPKDVGEAHPGYEGWSNGQAEKAEKAPPGQAKRAEKASKVPPGQAKKGATTRKVPPGQAKKADD